MERCGFGRKRFSVVSKKSGLNGRTAAYARKASPKNHTNEDSRPNSSTEKSNCTFAFALDVPQHLRSGALPKLLKHCLSPDYRATCIPLTQQHFFFSKYSAKLLPANDKLLPSLEPTLKYWQLSRLTFAVKRYRKILCLHFFCAVDQ